MKTTAKERPVQLQNNLTLYRQKERDLSIRRQLFL
jgi:hypothetical protein